MEKGTSNQSRPLRIETRHKKVGTVGKGISVGGDGRTSVERGHGRTGSNWKVRGTGNAKHNQFVVGNDHGVGLVGKTSAEVGGIQPLRSVGTELGYSRVDAVVGSRGERGVEGAGAGGVAGIKNNAPSIQVSLVVVGRREAPVVRCRAAERGEDQFGVNDQGKFPVVFPEAKTQKDLVALAFQQVLYLDLAKAFFGGLVGARGGFP